MIILVTGSRDWPKDGLILRTLQRLPPIRLLILGDARGVDRQAASAGYALGIERKILRADWAGEGRSAGHKRNGEMVKAALWAARPGEDVIALAFPMGAAYGTRDCWRQCDAAGIYVYDCSIV